MTEKEVVKSLIEICEFMYQISDGDDIGKVLDMEIPLGEKKLTVHLEWDIVEEVDEVEE